MLVSQHTDYWQQAIDKINTAVDTAIKPFKFTQPQMRAALAGHKAALTLLRQQQLGMACNLKCWPGPALQVRPACPPAQCDPYQCHAQMTA